MSENELPFNNYDLRKLALEQHQTITQQQTQIKQLQEMVNFLQRKQYAPQSEVVSSGELGIFTEIEDLIHTPPQEDEADDSEEDESESSEKKAKKKRRPRLPENLPRQEVIIDLDEKDKICPHDGARLEKVGEEVSEKLKIVPASVSVEKTIRYKYACPCCDEGMKAPPVPASLLPKTMASASLIAFIIISKFVDGVPFYRQEALFKRIGALLNRGTMARWLIAVSEKLMPLYNLLQDDILSRTYLQMDETTVQVLKEDGKKATSKSYMWVRYASGINPIVLYDYAPTRSGQVPLELLRDFKGHLQVDGYDGYSRVCEENKLVRLGCMDHARRKFMDAFKTSSSKGVGKKGLTFFKFLYKIEEDIEGRSAEEKRSIRQDKSKSILTEMKAWVDETKVKVPPQSVGGKALTYFINEYPYLVGYLEEGRFNISNCGVENKIRPFAIGRKNWLFSDSVDGAKASAMYYSLIETCKANNVEPFDWLMRVLEKLPHAEKVEDYEGLLPFKKN